MAKFNYTVFIPTHVYNTITESWTEFQNQHNWLEESLDDVSWWIESVKSIVRLDNNYILVIWNQTMQGGHNCSSIYKGELK